jgi:hypothetical protein
MEDGQKPRTSPILEMAKGSAERRDFRLEEAAIRLASMVGRGFDEPTIDERLIATGQIEVTQDLLSEAESERLEEARGVIGALFGAVKHHNRAVTLNRGSR